MDVEEFLYDPFTGEGFPVRCGTDTLECKQLCIRFKDHDKGLTQLASLLGLVTKKPRCLGRDGLITWQITQQLGKDLVVEYFSEGDKYTTKVSIPVALKDVGIDILRTAINMSVQGHIKDTRLIGLAGSFKDTSLSKLEDEETGGDSTDGKK